MKARLRWSIFIRALRDPVLVGLDFAKQRGQTARQREHMSKRLVDVSVSGLMGEWTSFALGLEHSVSSGM